MNANRRKALADVADMLEEAKSKLEDILGEEEEYRDNMGEAIDELENAIASVGDATE